MCDFSDTEIVVKGEITDREPNMQKEGKALFLKIMRHLSAAFQK